MRIPGCSATRRSATRRSATRRSATKTLSYQGLSATKTFSYHKLNFFSSSLLYGMPAPSAESQHPEAWQASTYGHKLTKLGEGMANCWEYHSLNTSSQCPAIQTRMEPGQTAQDPDLVAHVFKQKKDQLMHDIISGGILGM